MMMVLVGTIVLSVNMIKVNKAEINTTGTYFWVDPASNINETVSTLFNVTIKVVGAPAGTYGWQLTLLFDNNTLDYQAVYYGTFLDAGGSQYSPPASVVGGTLIIARTLLGAGSVSGSGTLCDVEFNVTATGSSALNLMDTKLVDVANPLNPVDYPNNDGFFSNVLLIHDVAVSAVTPAAAVVNEGSSVNIDVTVDNEGNYTEGGNIIVYADLVTHNPADPDTVLVGEITADTTAFAGLAAGGSTTPTLTWDTTGVPGETYTISAEATIASDDDAHDNLLIDNTVTVRWPHDLKVTDITLNTTQTSPGCGIVIVQINVTVLNQGQNQETFDLAIKGNDVDLTSYNNLGPLASGASTTITFNWNTASYGGVYTISAVVSDVAGEVDPNLDDNTLVDGTVHVKIYDMNIASIEILTPLASSGSTTQVIPSGSCAGLSHYVVIHFTLVNEGTDIQSVSFIVNATVVGGSANTVGSPYAGITFTIGSLIGISVEPGYDKRIDYYCVWDTTDLHIWGTPPSKMGGEYQISGYIVTHPCETDTGDNSRNTGLATVWVLGPGDVNQDGNTNVLDSLKLLVIRTVGY